MCNLYSVTTNQEAIRRLFGTAFDSAGNLPSMPGVFPDQEAPVVRNHEGGRQLIRMRWGMPPPKFGGPPVTNIRNLSSPHWRGWLKPASRCLAPASSFSDMRPKLIRRPCGSHSTKAGPCSPLPESELPSRATSVRNPNRCRVRIWSTGF
jgi:putative SOS response-associated peptidase YedK